MTTTVCGLASTTAMPETPSLGTMTNLSALWIGTETHILVTVPCTIVGAGGTMPVPTLTSMEYGIMEVITGADTRTGSTGPSSVVGRTL